MSNSLQSALRHLLKSPVRPAMKNEAVKGSYIDGAISEVEMTGNRVSREAIASMLNVEPSEIDDLVYAALINAGRDQQQSPVVEKLLAGWHTDIRTSGPYGLSLDLPSHATVESVRANALALTLLAPRYSPSDCPKTLLEEALRAECDVSVGEGFYRAIKCLHVPEALSPGETCPLFAPVVYNIRETCERNLRADASVEKGFSNARFSRYTHITRQDVNLFDRFVRAQGQLFADDVDTVNTGIGRYHFNC